MQYLKRTKAVKTSVKRYEKGADGKIVKDEKGNDKVAETREVEIKDVEYPKYESVAECIQVAGSEEKFLEAVNKWVQDAAIQPVRLVGNKFDWDTADSLIQQEGRETSKRVNAFSDQRGGGNAQNKAMADELRKLKEAAASGKVSAEDLLAMLTAGTI